MFEPNLIQRVFHKIHLKTTKIRAVFKRYKLKNKEFTIISNNCWGGLTYEEYGLPKMSPTVGGYFFPDDYLRFVSNLKEYIYKPLVFVPLEQSLHKKAIIENGNAHHIIARLGDVEIVFVHYRTEQEVLSKWNRRVKRINWNNLIFKFSYQNGATLADLEEFDKFDLPGKKMMFVNKKNMGYKCGIYYHGFESDICVWNDTFYAHRYFDVTRFLNDGIIIQK